MDGSANNVKSRSLLRNPYVWGFLIGIVTLTAIRPFLRYVPEPPPVLAQLPEFSLVGTDGRPYGSRELRGQVYVAGFVSASCPPPCPEVVKGMGRLQSALAERSIRGIRLVSISLDPERDTPESLGVYARGNAADAERWTFLTGDPEQVRRLIVDGFKSPAPGKLVLVDGLGRVRGTYGSDEMGLDEVFNRAQHVLRQEREAKRSE